MINEMKYVYAVYQEKSFSKAARKMFVSQPALSNMVKKAEAEIGRPIFDRSTIPLTVTKEGMYYIRSVEQIFQIQRNTENYFKDLQNLKRNPVYWRFLLFSVLLFWPALSENLNGFILRFPLIFWREISGS